jgi:hypothetical protein
MASLPDVIVLPPLVAVPRLSVISVISSVTTEGGVPPPPHDGHEFTAPKLPDFCCLLFGIFIYLFFMVLYTAQLK